jgi:hypothetical protein
MGEYLLMDALRRALVASRDIASLAVVVDAKDEAAVAFYRRYEFSPFADLPNRLFLPMGTIEQLFRGSSLHVGHRQDPGGGHPSRST